MNHEPTTIVFLDFLDRIPNQPQCAESLDIQIMRLVKLADRAGLYDAADHLRADQRKAKESHYERRLACRFLALPFRNQIAVANSLDVLIDTDRALNDDALFRTIFIRAAERGLLGRLWDETEKLHKDPADFNPFEGSPREERLRFLGF